ncbi:MAG: Flp pilus assembly complex ATPase component TadA, partial [Phycisphaerales bacterium]|nr:Flp pilus assembly complex ATPase component TadA [Phycisphaerales bacterium]
MTELKGQRLGRILTKMAKVNRDQVHEALQLQQQQRRPLGQLLIELGYIVETDLNIALAAQQGIEATDLGSMNISQDVAKILPAETAKAYQVLPIRYDAGSRTLTVALKNANNFRAIDDLKMLMGYNVRPVIADAAQIDKQMAKLYGGDHQEESLTSLIGELSGDAKLEALKDRGQSIDLDTLLEAADDNKVKRLLNLVLMQAIKDKASDVHFEPFEDEFKMRYRIDGVLYDMIPPPKYLAMPIVSRIKVMSNLDIAERRLPQDGRIELTVNNAPVDLRVAVLPTMFGESVVMRVLDRSNVQLDLEKLGLRHEDLDIFRQLLNKPNGIVIVTGP